MLKLRTISIVLAGTTLAGLAGAQSPSILAGPQVTEEALVNALEIDQPTAPQEATQRGFGPPTRPALIQPRPQTTGKANLLITFETNSATLTQEGKHAVDTLAKALQSDKLAGFAFKVEGHADPRGTPEHNQLLSEMRAKAVVDYLVSEHGILADRLDPIGKGSTELLNTRKQDADENRRVTIVTKR